MSVLGTILPIGNSFLADIAAGRYTYSDGAGDTTLVYTSVSGNVSLTKTGYYNYSTFPLHMLNKWNIKIILGANPIPTGRLGIGLYDYQNQGGPYLRYPYTYIDAPNHQMIFVIEGGTKFTTVIPSDFNFTGATFSVDFKDDLLSAVLIDTVNHIVLTNQWRYYVKTYEDVGVVPTYLFGQPGHQTNPLGYFSLVVDTTSNWVIANVGITSDVDPNMDILVTGHSIAAGRQNYPQTLRYSDRLAERYYQAGTPKVIGNFSSGGLNTAQLYSSLASIVAVNTARTAGTPMKVIINIGENDDITNFSISGFTIPLINLINGLTTAGMKAIVIAFTYNNNFTDTYDASQWLINNLPTRVATPSMLRVYDGFTPDFTAFPGTPDLTHVNGHDLIHRTKIGNQFLADNLYTYL